MTSPNLIRLVELLNDGEYHDGTALGDSLKMTRSAVWKMIKKLQSYGIEIESIKGKGYRMLEALNLLSLPSIKANLHLLETVESTNDYLKSFRGKKSLEICVAEQQTKGKGRLERVWHSPFGKNIYFSYLTPIQKDISELGGLSLVVSLAIVETLKAFIPTDLLGVKWPNDILYDGKKLSGTLIELQAESHGSCEAIIGVGMNVNMIDETSQINQSWTSTQKITGQYIDRNDVCTLLINNISHYLERLIEKGFASFLPEWEQVDCLRDKAVKLKNLNHEVSGKAAGINEHGHLLVEINGQVKAFSSGDASQVRA